MVLVLCIPGALWAAPLTDREKVGQEIYRKGTSPNGPVKALFGKRGTKISAKFLPCANCHGSDGTGRPEGALEPPNITWKELTKPYGHAHSDGRKHGPFDPDSLIRVIAEGIDPADNKLHSAMPKYVLTQQDKKALVAYLKVIDKDFDPGLTESSIKLGVILPKSISDKNPLPSLIRGFFQELNNKGGIYGRKVDLVFTKPYTDTQSYVDEVKAVVAEDVFALFGASLASADKDIFPLLKKKNVPLITPLIMTEWTDIQRKNLRFRLLPGPVQQAQALLAFAKTQLPASSQIAIVVPPEGNLYGQIWDTFQAEVKRYGWPEIESADYSGDAAEIPEIVSKLAKTKSQALFYFGPPGRLTSLMKEAEKQKWRPRLYAPVRVAAREAVSLPQAFTDRVFLSAPAHPLDYRKESLAEFQQLLRKYKVPQFFQIQSVYYYATLKVLVEGLQRSSQKLSRAQLIESLESLSNFETGLTPKITYGSNRRTGSLGTYILEVDLEKQRFKPGAVWVRLD